jgi:electron transport complex protein RnfB
MPRSDDLAAQIDALLPQTQCTRCGYPACRPYAEAMASGAAAINQCPPGGKATIERLAHLLGRAVLPLNPVHGIESPPTVAVIDETACVGCTKCLLPCPTDAIVGASRQMHTVIAALCTGCELCIAPCPVDCIRMVPRSDLSDLAAREAPSATDNRRRYQEHLARAAGREAERRREIARAKSGAGRGPA